MPVRAARMRIGSAATSAAWAVARLPLEIASSTLRKQVRMRERRALLIAVLRAILREAFFADLVLAIIHPGISGPMHTQQYCARRLSRSVIMRR